MNSVLVTGASGFVGTHLLEILLERGIQTTAVYFSNKPEKDLVGGNKLINWIKCDLASEDISDHLKGIDVVFHLAGYSGLGSDPDTVRKLNSINVAATERLASAALRAGSRFIYVSSVAACDDEQGVRIIDESNDGYPKSEYGRSKCRAEELLRELGKSGLDFTILRPTQLFGEYHEGSVFELVKVIIQKRFFIIGDGNNATNFYYVKDFVDILMRVAENPICKWKTYIAADEPLRLAALVDEICRHVGVNSPRFRLPRVMGMIMGSMCDITSDALKVKFPLSRQRVRAITRDVQYSNQRLITDIGMPAHFGVKTGLARTVKWYNSAGLL